MVDLYLLAKILDGLRKYHEGVTTKGPIVIVTGCQSIFNNGVHLHVFMAMYIQQTSYGKTCEP